MHAAVVHFEGVDSQRPEYRRSWNVDDDSPGGEERIGGRAHCGDLHAWLVREIGLWLVGRGVDPDEILWKLEYDGTWHPLAEIHLLGNPDKGAL